MRKQGMFIMVATVAIHRIQAALEFPKHVEDFVTYAQAIHDSMTSSTYFTTLAAKLTQLAADITTLQGKETGLKTKPPTNTSADRDAALIVVQNDLRSLKADVQGIADADMPNAEAIITASGMHVKKIGTISKQDFVARQGAVSGTVDLVAKGIPGNHGAHEWAMSPDGTVWTPLTTTIYATTTVTGLTPGSEMEFRHREILADGPGDWSQAEVLIVT